MQDSYDERAAHSREVGSFARTGMHDIKGGVLIPNGPAQRLNKSQQTVCLCAQVVHHRQEARQGGEVSLFPSVRYCRHPSWIMTIPSSFPLPLPLLVPAPQPASPPLISWASHLPHSSHTAIVTGVQVSYVTEGCCRLRHMPDNFHHQQLSEAKSIQQIQKCFYGNQGTYSELEEQEEDKSHACYHSHKDDSIQQRTTQLLTCAVTCLRERRSTQIQRYITGLQQTLLKKRNKEQHIIMLLEGRITYLHATQQAAGERSASCRRGESKLQERGEQAAGEGRASCRRGESKLQERGDQAAGEGGASCRRIRRLSRLLRGMH